MAEEAKLVYAFVKRKISVLCEARNEAASRAELAKLRRGIGKPPGSMSELWGITLEGMPEELLGGKEPSTGEWAAYTALTLFALHQQGKDLKRECMSREGLSLGASVRTLIKSEDEEARVKRRFDAAATASSIEEFTTHLRGLVQLLKAEGAALDYPALAKDIHSFQNPAYRDSVRLNWGREFYKRVKRETEAEETEAK